MNRLGNRIFSWVRRFAQNHIVVGLLLAGLSLGGRAVLLRSVPIPEPGIQDEFSYLLAADTFASVRLTNPQHPLWIHFETVHEIMRPTYQSKYPPAQSMLLALGQVIFGHPWFGIWLSMGALTAAIYWALIGWLPPPWALLGGLLALSRVGFFNYWSESYWGGAVAAAAGALVIGAVPRLTTRPTMRISLVFGIGLAVLANSRPFEGALLGAICSGAVLVKLPGRKFVLPVTLVLVLAGFWMAYYNYRVTESPWLLPYSVHERQYAVSSQFFWDTQPAPTPHYNHEALRAVWIDWANGQRINERAHPWQVRLSSFWMLNRFFLGWPTMLCVVLFLVPIFRYQPKLRLGIWLTLLYLAALQIETTLLPHYAAPGTAFVFLLAAASLRRLWHLSPLTMILATATILYFDYGRAADVENRWLYDKRDFIARREAVLKQLSAAPGPHLVLVEFGPGHDVNHEWVYNRADIDASAVVWARKMRVEEDRELLMYYPSRTVWKLVERDDGVVLSVVRLPQ